MIVVAGIPSEPPTRMVIDAARDLGIETCVMSQRDSAHAPIEIYRFGGNRRTIFRSTHGPVDIDNMAGAYIRLADFRQLPEYTQSRSMNQPVRARIEAWHAALSDIFEASPALVMNRLKPSNSNMSKPYQAQLIAACGFRTPRTLITNQPEEARRFKLACGRVVFKSISAQRSVVTELTTEREKTLERIRYLPTQFQELLTGDDVRVHLVCGDAFSTLIKSNVIDYRYASDQGASVVYQPFELPDDVHDRCLRLAKTIGLPLSGIDLKRLSDGSYACFEVNPSPAFSAFGEQSRQIAHSIASHLAGGV